jgi:hypothetical protein
MVDKNMINEKSLSGKKGRDEGYLFEEQVAEAINEAPYEVTATPAEQLVESAVSSRRGTKNKSDIEVSSPKMDTPIGISIKNPARAGSGIQIQIINRRNLLAQLNTIKEVPKDVEEYCNLFFGGNLEDDYRRLDIDHYDYGLLDFQWERRRDRAYWGSIPQEHQEAFLDYFNDSEVKKETVKTVIKKGVTTLPGAEFQLWCNPSVAGKGKVDYIVAFDIDKLVESICKHEWLTNHERPKIFDLDDYVKSVFKQAGHKLTELPDELTFDQAGHEWHERLTGHESPKSFDIDEYVKHIFKQADHGWSPEYKLNGCWKVKGKLERRVKGEVKVWKVKVSYPDEASECSGLHLGPITLQMKGSGEKRSAGYHSMQFNASLSAILLACPEAVIHKGSVSELAGLIDEGKLKGKKII